MPPIELNIRFPSKTQVIVKFDDNETEALAFASPFDPHDFTDIAWYLETYAAGYIADVDIDRAESIAKRLTELGEKLFKAVFSDSTAFSYFKDFQDTDQKRIITINANHAAVLSLLREPQLVVHCSVNKKRIFAI